MIGDIEKDIAIITIKYSTKFRFLELVNSFKDKYPELRINQDYVLKKLMDTFEGGLQ